MRALLLLLAACAGDPGSVDTAEDTGGTGDVGDTGPAPDPGPLGTLTGRLVDGAGAPLVDVVVTMCREVCTAERTDEQGAFVHDVAPGTWAMEITIEPGKADTTWATPLAPVTLIEDETVALDAPVVVPRLGARVGLDAPGWFDLGDGLSIEADPAGWEAPAIDPDADPWLAAVGLDPTSAGLPLEGLEGEPLALWYVAPTNSHPATPWALRVDNDFDLAPGETVQLWVSDYGTQSWKAEGVLTVVEDGSVLASAEGEGLSVLGSVVLMR